MAAAKATDAAKKLAEEYTAARAREHAEEVEEVMSPKTVPFDAAEFLDSEEAIEEFLTDAFETADPAYMTRALGIVARARNMSKLAQDIGMSRSALYRASSGEGNPEFATIVKAMQAMGLRLTASSAKVNSSARRRKKAA